MLPKSQFKDGLGGVAAQELNAAVVVAHDLAGQGEAYSGALFLGGIEGNEDF